MSITATWAGSAPGGIVLTIPDQVEIESTDITLGQLAEIDSADATRVKSLQDIMIGRAPLAGQSRSVSRDYILLRLRQSGCDPASMTLNAPEKVTLVRRAVHISAADIEMLVREYVVAHPPFAGADLTITGVRVPGDILLPTGAIQHELQYLPQSRPSGTLPVNVVFNIDGVPVKRMMATVNVVMLKDVPVTRHPIARYQFVQPDDLMMQTVDVTDLPANTVYAFDEIEGQRARRSIGPQSILRQDQFEFPPAVKRGDRVLIVAEGAGLRITALGEVQNPAKVGERVRVVNLDSNKTLLARVVDARTVQVEF
jgi:flagella basal body P-ring formation protein FlgA